MGKLKKTHVDWIKNYDDLPNPENIIQITDDNKKEWLMLEGFMKWEQITPPQYKKYDIPIREVWYILKSYIVEKKDSNKFYKWAKKKNYFENSMSESYSIYEIFLGEYPNSSAFEDLRKDYDFKTKLVIGNDDLKPLN